MPVRPVTSGRAPTRPGPGPRAAARRRRGAPRPARPPRRPRPAAGRRRAHQGRVRPPISAGSAPASGRSQPLDDRDVRAARPPRRWPPRRRSSRHRRSTSRAPGTQARRAARARRPWCAGVRARAGQPARHAHRSRARSGRRPARPRRSSSTSGAHRRRPDARAGGRRPARPSRPRGWCRRSRRPAAPWSAAAGRRAGRARRPSSVSAPAYPCSRSATTVCSPASPAPTTTITGSASQAAAPATLNDTGVVPRWGNKSPTGHSVTPVTAVSTLMSESTQIRPAARPDRPDDEPSGWPAPSPRRCWSRPW